MPERRAFLYMRQVARLGQQHPDVASTLGATAGLLKAMGRTADAETVYRLVRGSAHRRASAQRDHSK